MIIGVIVVGTRETSNYLDERDILLVIIYTNLLYLHVSGNDQMKPNTLVSIISYNAIHITHYTIIIKISYNNLIHTKCNTKSSIFYFKISLM